VNPPKLLIDENLSPTVAVALQRDGVDVVHVRDRAMNGSSDVDVFACAFSEDRIVVTLNVVDFEQLARRCSVRAGLVLVETASLTRPQQLQLVQQVWSLLLAEHQSGRDMVNRALYISVGGHRFEPIPT
jgi:predicted nuclease of predicted toxin-antitoxin system